MAKLSKLVVSSRLRSALQAARRSDDDAEERRLDTGVPKVDPTLCDTNGKNVVTYDLNNDNQPDVWRLYKTEDEGGTKIEFMTCKQVDFDHDGRKDWVVAYNRKGNPLFEKARLRLRRQVGHVRGLRHQDRRSSPRSSATPTSTASSTSRRSTTPRGALTSVRRDRNGDGQPDLWEQYKDTILLAILYDDDFDGKVDRREEIPGARPKVEMPTTLDPTATGTLDRADQPPGSRPPGKSPAAPLAPKK